MKILVFSDTHGQVNSMTEIIKNNSDVDLIIHLGDYVRDALQMVELFKEKQFEIIKGNNDFNSNLSNEELLVLQDKKILITHGHSYNVKSNYISLIKKGQNLEADAVLFGHTHCPEESNIGSMLLFNPGSLSKPFGKYKKTYGLLRIKKGILSSEIKPY